LGAVLGIFVVSATFSRLLSGFWGAVLEISAVTATFLGFYPVFGLNFGSCFKDLVITAPQGLPTMLSIPCKP
jgi:uncharacterized membrane protein YjjP (DUF1212 family)